MSVRVMADVWDFGPKDPIDCSLLLALANHCNDEGRNCFPSIERLSSMIRRSRATVTRSITRLETDGWISVQRGKGRGNISQYEVNVTRLKTLQRDTFYDQENVSASHVKGSSVNGKRISGDFAIRKNHHRTTTIPINRKFTDFRDEREQIKRVTGARPQ